MKFEAKKRKCIIGLQEIFIIDSHPPAAPSYTPLHINTYIIFIVDLNLFSRQIHKCNNKSNKSNLKVN